MSANLTRRQFLSLAGASGFALALGLVGCGGTGTSSAPASTAASTGDKKYVIATDTVFAPFEFTNSSNEFVGIDVDILAAVAKEAGFAYEMPSLGFDAAVAALESGQADGVMAGMSITEKRKEKYDFSESYYDSYPTITVKDGGPIASTDDLKGKTCAAKTGTTAADWAEAHKDQYGYTISYFETSDLMYQDVLTGNSAACFEDYPVMAYGISQGNGLKILTKDESYKTPYAFAVLKGHNGELLDLFKKGFDAIKANGTYDQIIGKYLKA